MAGRLRTVVAMLGVLCTLSLALPGRALASGGRTPPSVTVTADRVAIRPRADPVQVTVTSTEDGDVTFTVAGGGGGPDVATLSDHEPILAGVPFAVNWNGTDTAGAKVPDGRYVVAASVEGSDGITTESADVWVDGVAPTASWVKVSPEPLTSTGAMHLSFDLADAGAPAQPISVKLRVLDAFGRVVRRTQATDRMPGRRSLDWDGRLDGGRLAPNGLYGLSLLVTDAAGNVRASRARSVRVVRPVTSLKIYSVANTGNRVALTFDDCGSSGAWRSILATLKRTHTEGTIFCSGYRVAAEPLLARRTVAQGVPIGNHGWDHPTFTRLSDSQLRSQLLRTSAAWWRVAGVTPIPYFRPPYGTTDARVERIAGQLGYRYTVLWNVDPRDWSGISPSQIAHNVVSVVRPGGIVVMHMKSATAQALPSIIAGLRRRGLQPVSIPKLLRAGR